MEGHKHAMRRNRVVGEEPRGKGYESNGKETNAEELICGEKPRKS